MGQVSRLELLATLKDGLRALESARATSSDDPHLVRVKQNLRRRIAEVEDQVSTTPDIAD